MSCLSWTRMQITVGRSTLIKWVLVQSSTNTENSGRESKKPPEKNKKSPGNTHSQGYVTKLQRTTKQKNNWRLRQHTSMHPVCARRSNWFKNLLEQGRQWQISQVMREKISSVVHVFIYKKKKKHTRKHFIFWAALHILMWTNSKTDKMVVSDVVLVSELQLGCG